MRMRNIVRAILKSLLVVCAITNTAEAQFEWKPGFEWPDGNGLNSGVGALTVFDDGTGPALYAGGSFTIAGTEAYATYIAKWNGASWTPLGSDIDFCGSCGVSALTVFDDGAGPALYAAGRFSVAGGQLTNNIAKWDGQAWTPLGTGTNNTVLALAVFDDGTGAALYAGGLFSAAGDVPANRIAKWNGTTWEPLGNGLTNGLGVFALSVFDNGTSPALVAGGNFFMAGDVTVNSVARWDGISWASMGAGISRDVLTFTVFDDGHGPALYAGGGFGALPGRVGKWEGDTSWTLLGTGFTSATGGAWIGALIVFDEGDGPTIYAAGRFTTASGEPANNIAKWTGGAWAPLATGTDNTVSTLGAFDDGTGSALFAGGGFSTAGGVPSNSIAKWAAQQP